MNRDNEKPDNPAARPLAPNTGADDAPTNDGRFVKGTSGNPQGRPKKKKIATVSDRPSMHAFGHVAYRRVTPLIDGEPTPMTMIEALIQRRFAVAMKGENRLLMRELIHEAAAYEQEAMEASVRAYLKHEKLKRDGEAILAAAAAAGRPAPVLLPHPDDIILDEQKVEYRIAGPETEAQLAVRTFMVMVRDFMVMRWAYQSRFPVLVSRRIALNTFERLAVAFNELLPVRLKWRFSSFRAACGPYAKIGIRAFDKLMRNAQYAIEALRNTFKKKAARTAARMAPYLDWRSQAQERRILDGIRDRSRLIASLLVSDPRVAEDMRTALTEADLPRLYAKVPDLMKKFGLVLRPDGHWRYEGIPSLEFA